MSKGRSKKTAQIPQETALLQKLAEDRVCYAVCWNQTSVSDTWYVRDDDEEDSRLYDISKDEDHWFLFDELERINANDSQSK